MPQNLDPDSYHRFLAPASLITAVFFGGLNYLAVETSSHLIPPATAFMVLASLTLATYIARQAGFLYPLEKRWIRHALGENATLRKKRLALAYIQSAGETGWMLEDALPLLISNLHHPNELVRTGVQSLLPRRVDALHSLASLERSELAMENSFVEWLEKQPQETTLGKIRTQEAVSLFLQRVAERKAKLVQQKDGELLAGETIRVPRKAGCAKLYLAMRNR